MDLYSGVPSDVLGLRHHTLPLGVLPLLPRLATHKARLGFTDVHPRRLIQTSLGVLQGLQDEIL